jgi:hypothetical protein
MAENGERRPPGARIEITSGSATEEEAAAIASALESFLAEQAAGAVAGAEPQSGWQRAALIEGVGAKAEVDYPWLRG